ncbi:hypothetical protein HaLaN_22769 [Haematococcus lacustris]|uniref:Uncharacterized protein n=1 Tax=Haematococcus lacustris TaxID=44745 RepID=A0A699ZSJ8_HAELA|nr:hypothetical protein HaLaN_22769 [Haematococcus lacustris]
MHDMSVAHNTEVRQTWLRELPDGAGRLARMCTRSRLSLAYHSATWPPPTQLNPPSPNLVYPAQLPVAPPPSLPSASSPLPLLLLTSYLSPTSPSPISPAEVQRLRDVEQSLMGAVDGLQGDLDDLQAAHQRLQGEHTALQQGQVRIYRHNRRPHHSPLTCKQRQQLLVLEQHPVSVEVLKRYAEAGYGRLDGHGRPMGSMAEQLSPAGLSPSPTDIFIPTQEAPVGRPAARTVPYNAHHCLSTVRLHLETRVSRRALSKCRQFFVSEQCVLPNPHRPGKTSTFGREFHIVSTYMRRKSRSLR